MSWRSRQQSYWGDFAAAERHLKSARNGMDRPIANNTRLIRRSDDAIAIRLHQTDVVTMHRDGGHTLSSGGWETVTTQDRISSCGFSVGASYIRWLPGWVVPEPGCGGPWYAPEDKRHIFFSGIHFDANGRCTNSKGTVAEARIEHEEEVRETRAAVAKGVGFARFAANELERTAMDADPLYCAGCANGGSCTEEHLHEREVPPSMILRAVAEYSEADPRTLLGFRWEKGHIRMGGRRLPKAFKREISSALYQYINERSITHGSRRRIGV